MIVDQEVMRECADCKKSFPLDDLVVFEEVFILVCSETPLHEIGEREMYCPTCVEKYL